MATDPEIVSAFDQLSWPYLPTNTGVLEELEDLLWKAAESRRGEPLIYSRWVQNQVFVVPRYAKGRPFTMEVEDWQPWYSHVIGDILGWLNARSYRNHGVLISSMAINKESHRPGERFFGLCEEVGLFDGGDELRFWMGQMELVREVAKSGRAQDAPDLQTFLSYVVEGEKAVADVKKRKRCAELASAAREAHRECDGRLKCKVCGWAKPNGPIRGDIVQMHHIDPLAKFEKGGRQILLSDAKALLIPLCPRCHSVAHAKNGGGEFTIDELIALLGTNTE